MNAFETHDDHSTSTALRIFMGIVLVFTVCAPMGIALNSPTGAQAATIGPGSVITGTLLCVDGTIRYTRQGIPTDGYYQYGDRDATIFKFQIRSSDDSGALGDSFGGNWFWMECSEPGLPAPRTGEIYNFSFGIEEMHGNTITGTMTAGINNELSGTDAHHQNTRAHITVDYIPPTGGLQMNKRSDAENITNGNSIYSLGGIEFGIWTDPDCNSETHGTGKSIVLDENGYGHVEDLLEGTYYIRELEDSMSGTNYAHNASVQQATVVKHSNDVWIHYTANGRGDISGNDVSNTPISDEMDLHIRKVDAETGNSSSVGAASLAGAKFKMSYFANTNGITNGNPDRAWYYLTDETGSIACMDEGSLLTAESSALFKNAAGDTTLPLGTYTVEEIKPPEGYLPAVNARGEKSVYKFLVTADGSHKAHATKIRYVNQEGKEYEVAHADDGIYLWPDADLTVLEQVKRGNVQFVKQDDNSNPVANCPFLLRALDADGSVIEQHVIVTGENGVFDSSYGHSASTNANDAALTIGNDGAYRIDPSKLDANAGVWFGIDASGTLTNPDDNKGALPYGTYDLIELASATNASLRLVGSRGITITHNGQLVNLGTITDKHPAIRTSARDAADGDSLLTSEKRASIADVVNYENLNPGQTYTVTGKLMNKMSGQALVDAQDREITAWSTFTPAQANGSITLHFDFDASALADDTDLVVFETLTTGDGITVASHEDIEDFGQTVRVVKPNIKTSIQDKTDGDRIIVPDEQLTLIDTVSYSGLTVGRRYEVTGVLVDKATGRALEVNGQAVTGSTSFVAHETQGETPVTFIFDSTGLEDTSEYVAFETLTKDDVTLAVHADLHDINQTVTMERPRIATTASDAVDRGQIAYADTDTTIVDTVSYKGLTPGREYTMTGTLMDKSTNEIFLDANGLEVTSTTTFTADASSGNVELAFTFDASHINAALQVVAFETLSYAGTELTTHAEIEDRRQTITILQPTIATSARDALDGDKIVCRDLEACIIDTVSYTGLKPGSIYTILGTLMDKSTEQPVKDGSGNEITASVEFAATAETGSVDLTFAFDATYVDSGTELVCFETLLRDGRELASHLDIEDARQTVSIQPPSLKTNASDADDGDKTVFADEQVSIADIVAYSGLTPGREYAVTGTLMDKKTQAPVLDADGNTVNTTRTFVPRESEGSIELVFAFNTAHIYEEQTYVAFENLYREERLLAIHANIDDSAQTVDIAPPHIQTSAADADDNDKTIMRGEQTTIVDTVTYGNLTAGEEYELTGTLMINDGTIAGTPALDAFGLPITARKTFTATEPHGVVEINFTIDSTLFGEGTRIVAFEEVSHNGTIIASHEDIKDESQTVFIAQPAIKTRVYDASDDDQELQLSQDCTLVDTIEYSGLNSGETYIVQGKLMDKATGEPIAVGGREISAKRQFVATGESGSIDVEFKINTLGLAGKDVVAFERLTNSNNVTLATHEDIHAQKQTAHVAGPVSGSPLTRTLKSIVKTADTTFWIIVAYLICGAAALATFAILRKRSH